LPGMLVRTFKVLARFVPVRLMVAVEPLLDPGMAMAFKVGAAALAGKVAPFWA